MVALEPGLSALSLEVLSVCPCLAMYLLCDFPPLSGGFLSSFPISFRLRMLPDGGCLSQQHFCGLLLHAMLVCARGFPKGAECEQLTAAALWSSWGLLNEGKAACFSSPVPQCQQTVRKSGWKPQLPPDPYSGINRIDLL